jgi:hypothetical protein
MTEKTKRSLILAAGLLAIGFAEKTVSAEEHYRSDFERSADLAFWSGNGAHALNFLGLSEEKARSGKKTLKLDVTLNEGTYCYFKIPLNIYIQPGDKYYLRGYLLPERLPPGIKAGLGWSRLCHYGEERRVAALGNCPVEHLSSQGTEWVFLEKEIGADIVESATLNGMPSDKITMDAIYIDIRGSFNGQRVVLYIDDIRLSSEPPAEKETTAREEPGVGDYPKIRDLFVFGVCSGLGGANDPCGVRFPDYSWTYIQDWKSHFINTILASGGYLFADSPESQIERLSMFLKIFDANNLNVLPSVYLTRFYRPALTKEFCEKSIRRIIPKFKDHSSLLAWWIIDEIDNNSGALEDYLWGKHAYEEADPNHPALAGACGIQSIRLLGAHPQALVFDCYPVRSELSNPWSVGNWVSLAVKHSKGPVWFIPQAFGEGGESVKPTVPELRLMSYLPIAKGAKGLIYFAYKGNSKWHKDEVYDTLTDIFGAHGDTWDEVGRLGKNISCVGPLLLNTRPTASSLVKIRAEEITIAYEERSPAVGAGVLRESDSKHFLVVYNNDTSSPRKAVVSLDNALKGDGNLYDLYELRQVTLSPGNGGDSFEASLAPGDGKIYLVSPEKEFQRAKEKVLSLRFTKEKESIKYKLYQACLSRLSTPEILSLYQRADTQAALSEVDRRLDALLAGDREFSGVRTSLGDIQRTLSGINRVLEAKVKPADGKNSVVKGYTDALWMLGGWYWKLQTLFQKGKYNEISSAAGTMKELSDELRAQTEAHFVKKSAAGEVCLPAGKTEFLRAKIEGLEKDNPPSFPRPGDFVPEKAL